ncbi:TolC family protein [Paraburkholderia lacunae]|uniref:Type I secretion protein TolC n=1 Tax=Paraburkholderia lacunae TaxID=2211104 RepID=A0A370NFF7_9BURK|nr:TolC family protein [Paraburkholderia lacunae]RDK04346.1 type I secretion protein TolC [Paraburkholderia lacunae]
MNKQALLAACVAAMVGLWGHSNDACAVDLLSVVEQAVDHDADLAALRAASSAARQAVPKARAGLLPRVQGGWGRAYNSTAIEALPRTSYWQNGWIVNLTQPIVDWSRWTAYRQAGLVEARGVVDVARAQQASILRAARAYFDELAAEDEFARAIDYNAALDAHMDQLRRRQAAGEATVIDLQEAQSGREQAQLQLMDARNDLQLKRLALEQLTGQPLSALSRLSNTATLPRLEPDGCEAWADQAEAHDYVVQLKQIDRKIAGFDVEKARANHYPTVSVTASHSPAGAAGGFTRPTTTTTAMFAITIPIFEGGETEAKLDESVALKDKAQNDLVSATRQAGGAARENWARFRSGTVRAESLARLLQTSRAAVAAAQVGFKVGSRASSDVLRAVDVFYATRRDLIRTRYDTLLALLQLKSAAASLTIDEVAQVNSLLMPGDRPSAPQGMAH